MHRLFIGLRPPSDIRAALLACRGGVGGARWQDDDQLHLTLRYIGEVDRHVAEDVAIAMARVRSSMPKVALQGVGRFEKQGRTNAIWAGVAPLEPLATLHQKVDRALTRIGLAPETRAYLPHITLARLPRALGAEAEVDAFLSRHAGLSSPPFGLTHLTLFESQLTRDGARYEAVARWPLED